MNVNEWLLFQSANGPLQSGPGMCEGSILNLYKWWHKLWFYLYHNTTGWFADRTNTLSWAKLTRDSIKMKQLVWTQVDSFGVKTHGVLPLLLAQYILPHNKYYPTADLSVVSTLFMEVFSMHTTQKEESCGKQKREKTELRSRGSRLALMVNDMLALWLGLARAPELLKYLHGVQNLFTSNQPEQRGRESKHGQFPTSSLNWGNSTSS